MLWPWLPRVALMTSWGKHWVLRKCSKYVNPPRTLNAPTGVWFSCLTQQSVPSRWLSVAQRYCGVGPKAAYTVWAAASICESVGRSVMVFSGSSDIKCPSERDQALDAAHHIAAYPDLAAFVL